MGIPPAVFRGLLSDIYRQELSIRYPGRLDIGTGISRGGVVGMPPYHHTVFVPEKAGLGRKKALLPVFEKIIREAKISA